MQTYDNPNVKYDWWARQFPLRQSFGIFHFRSRRSSRFKLLSGPEHLLCLKCLATTQQFLWANKA